MKILSIDRFFLWSVEPSLLILSCLNPILFYARVSFYNLVTDFYEYGWGQSFHFAPRRNNETFRESIRRAEYVLASRIEVGGGPLTSCELVVLDRFFFAQTQHHLLLRKGLYCTTAVLDSLMKMGPLYLYLVTIC